MQVGVSFSAWCTLKALQWLLSSSKDEGYPLIVSGTSPFSSIVNESAESSCTEENTGSAASFTSNSEGQSRSCSSAFFIKFQISDQQQQSHDFAP